jgi:hypothetical protein
MRESLLSESPGRQNLADAGFEFLRYFQVSNEKLPAADEIFAPTEVLPPSFCFPHTCLPFCRNGQSGINNEKRADAALERI